MRKKIIGILLCVVLSCSFFAGCTLFEHNDEKDAQQVIAVIDPIEDTSNGVTFVSKQKNIYKSDLISAMNSYAQTYMQNYSLTLEQATERLLDELIVRELLLVEAERLLRQGYIDWTQKDDNDQLKSVYGAIDSLLSSLQDNVLGDFDETTPDGTAEEEKSDTTYPTPDAETTDEDYTYYQFDENGNILYTDKVDSKGERIPDYAVWAPDESSYPAWWGAESKKSLERESMQRLVTRIQSLIESDFKATNEDRAKFAEDEKKVNEIINTKGIEYVYPMLGSTHWMQYLAGESARQSILISKLQEYIVGSVEVTEKEVVDAYVKQLGYQKATYTADPSAYQTAVKDGNTTMLYYHDDSYFFVKHILLPFSDEQTAAMNAYKADPANAGKDYKIMRDSQMVNETVVYPHVNGENDLSSPKTVQQVYNEIEAAMAPLAVSPKEAERKFDEFTYKYNTDSGAFGTGKSYAVKRGDEEGHSGYMEEFYDGAMKLLENYKVGQLLPELVVTDYGVHIMYFSQDVIPGTVRALSDYLTPGAYKTVYETFEDTVRTAKENDAFTAWQNERITYYRENKNVVRTYVKRYKSLYED